MVAQRGFAYLWVLGILLVMGIYLAAVGELWSTHVTRSKEAQLLSIGREFQHAFMAYYKATPAGQAQHYPTKLEDLLKDPRVSYNQRFLRRIYRDPFTGKADWGLIQATDGGIMGVYSQALGVPIKTKGFLAEEANFVDRTSYKDWRFAYTP